VNSSIIQLTNKDIVVFWGRVGDIKKTNTNVGLKYMLDFVVRNKHTNIILLQAPHRYDLKEWSCVNVERKTYNRKLNKLMKNQKHVTIMNVDFERECFTSHGLHMIGRGKTMIAQQIADRCKKMFLKEKTHPMQMK
jgi:hypothetical protein